MMSAPPARKKTRATGRVTLDRAIKELPQVFDLGVSENSRAQSAKLTWRRRASSTRRLSDLGPQPPRVASFPLSVAS